MKRLSRWEGIALGVGLAIGVASCGGDREPLPSKPDLSGFAVMAVDTTSVANNGEVTVALAVTDSKGRTNFSEEEVRIRVWERPLGGEKALVYDSAALAAPALGGAPAAPKKPGKKVAPPINLAMVLDRSGSMNRREQGDMQDAALTLLGFLRAGDQVEVINVSTEVHVDASFRSAESREVERAITNPSVRKGWTKIYDGVLQGVLDSAHARTFDMRRAVFVVTDGEDNRSTVSLDSLIAKAQDEGVRVFVLGLADESDPTDLHPEELGRLASETGGRFVVAYDSSFFEAILAALTRSLTDEVVFSYQSPLGDAPRTATIEVTVGNEPPTTTDVRIVP